MILLQLNSDLLFIIAITVAMLLVISFFSVYLFFLFQNRKIRLLNQQQQMKDHFEQEVLRTQIEIRDQTMKDVGHELHDHVGQVLTVIKMTLAQMQLQNDHANTERLSNAEELVGNVIQDLRSLGKTLNGDIIKQVGLVDSIELELNRINRLNLTACELMITGDPFGLPEEKEFVIFRVVQENLNNILKHAKSKHIITHLQYSNDRFTLCQKDDGIGYDQPAIKARKLGAGGGLLNMQRRCELINAQLKITSSVGVGSQLEITVTP